VFERAALALAAVGALALSGCAGSSNSTSAPGSPSTSSSPTPSPPSLAADAHTALAQRLGAATEFPGEKAAQPALFETAESFLSTFPIAPQVAVYRDEGLQAVVTKHLEVPGTNDAIRLVLMFDDAAGATHDVQHPLQGPPGSTFEKFKVPGIANGSGNEVAGPDGVVHGRNVMFAVGAYEYVIGVAPTDGAKQAPSRSRMIRLARQWYQQVKEIT